jgi:hypothetical protein
MSGDTRSKGPGAAERFDAGVSEQSIRKALDYARRLRGRGDGDLLDLEGESVDEPVTLDLALSELPRMLQRRRTGMYRVPTQTPPKPEE